MNLKVLQVAFTDPAVPWYAKAIIVFTIGYALIPVDLIPDFIPILGLVDDLLILPLLIYIAIKLIPADTLQQIRQRAETENYKPQKNWVAGGLIICIWLTLLVWLIIKLTKLAA